VISDVFTAEWIAGSSSAEISSISDDDIVSYNCNKEMDTLQPNDSSPDELMRVEMKRIDALQEQVIAQTYRFGEYFNPAIAQIDNNSALIISRKGWKLFHESIKLAFLDLNQIKAYSARAMKVALMFGKNNKTGLEDSRILRRDNDRFSIVLTGNTLHF
jgi:predicted GH43/DUF377 family glycosyl hydrolase